MVTFITRRLPSGWWSQVVRCLLASAKWAAAWRHDEGVPKFLRLDGDVPPNRREELVS
jgi:hypothetical protein